MGQPPPPLPPSGSGEAVAPGSPCSVVHSEALDPGSSATRLCEFLANEENYRAGEGGEGLHLSRAH